MSMFALCADSVSCVRTGNASALICWSLPLPLGYCGTSTAVILPLATVSATCTGPQRVWATEPVTVVPDVVEPVPLLVPELLPVDGAAAVPEPVPVPGATGAATTVSLAA